MAGDEEKQFQRQEQKKRRTREEAFVCELATLPFAQCGRFASDSRSLRVAHAHHPDCQMWTCLAASAPEASQLELHLAH